MLKVVLLLISTVVVLGSVCKVQEYDVSFLYNNHTELYEMHGLWPEQCCNQLGWPEFCQNVTFDTSVLAPIIDQLHKIWFPSNNRDQQMHLIKHEYIKHGSCTPYSEFDYFNNTLCLYQNLDTSTCRGRECLFSFTNNTICNLTYSC